MALLEGIFPILNTPFHEDGTIDLEGQARLAEHLLAAGARGFGLFGNASEGYTLLAEERRRILEVVTKLAGGRVPLVVSSGHTGTDAAVALSREAEDLGAAALMVLPPYFLKTDGDGLLRYFDAISNAVRIPIMVQDAPLLTQVAMPAPLLIRMAQEIERVRYVKVEAPPTPPKVSAVVSGGGPVVFGGLNCQFMIEEFQRGARGMMPGSDLIAEIVQVWTLLETDRSTEAWELFSRILPLLRFELQPGLGVSAMKHNLVAAGVIRSARVRHPTASLDPTALKELGFLRDFARSAANAPPPEARP